MMQFLYGDNSFAIDAFLKQAIQEHTAESGELSVEQFDAAEASTEAILQGIHTLPFLVDKKLVVIRHAGAVVGIIDTLLENLEAIAGGVRVLCDVRGIDRRKSTFKEIKKRGLGLEQAGLSGPQLDAWVSSYARELGATISQQDAAYLVQRVGADQQRLAREIEKLATFDSSVNKTSIDMLTEQSLKNTVFSLLDAAFSGNAERAVAMYREQRQANVEPVYILAMIVWQLMILAQAVHAPGNPESSLIEAGHAPYTARKTAQLARSITKQKLQTIVDASLQTDRAIKTSADMDAALELLLLSL